MQTSRIKINCSSIGSLMSRQKGNYPPTEKEMKECFGYLSREFEELSERQRYIAREILTKTIQYDPDGISETTKKEICEIYAYEVYGKSALNGGGTKPLTLTKGILAEDESIKLLSRVDGVEYRKNSRLVANRYLKGVPDIVIGQYRKYITGVKDIKTSFDLPEFLSLVGAPPKRDHVWQMMGYLDILGLESGEICYCLTNMPDSMRQAEEERLKNNYQKMDLEEAEIERRLFAIKSSMIYDEIPDQMRVIRHKVHIDRVKTREIHSRVTLARKWLNELDSNFNDLLDLYDKTTTASQTESTN